MTISLWSTVFTDNVSTIPAAFLNFVRTNLAKAVDGVGGGVITPSAVLEVQGTAGFKINGSGTAARLQYGSRSLSRVQTGLLWNVTAGSFNAGLITVGAGQTGVQMFDRLPQGATITGITVYLSRTTPGVLPTTRPTVALRKRNIVTAAGSAVAGPTQDTTAVLATYEAHHPFAITGLSEVVDNRTTVYYLDFTGEVGGATSSVVLYPALLTYTVTDQDEAP